MLTVGVALEAENATESVTSMEPPVDVINEGVVMVTFGSGIWPNVDAGIILVSKCSEDPKLVEGTVTSSDK